MFDKLEDLLIRYEEIMGELQEPDVVNDQSRFRKLMKEQNDLTPIVEAYKEYKNCKQNIEDSLSLLEEESDEEMKELAKEELSESKKRVEELEQELKILLLPKDPNDDKNVIVEIRAGAGGDEAALFAAEIYRMYVHYADSRRWKTEMISLNENGIGGFKEVVFMITGQGAYSRMKYESGVHRVKTYEAIIKGENIPEPGIPESFKVLLKELQSLGLDVRVLDENNEEVQIMESVDYGDTNLNHIIEGDRRYNNDEDYGKHGYSKQEFSEGELVDVEDEPEEDDSFDDFDGDMNDDFDDDMDLE